MNAKKINLLTFLGISATIIVLGFSGVHHAVNNIRAHYIEVQLESNRRTAETISRILDRELASGGDPAMLIANFQSAIDGSHSHAGYLCMFDQDEGTLIFHPDREIVGMSIDSEHLRFYNKAASADELLIDAVSTDKAEYGILSMHEPHRSELAYMMPVHGTNWKVSVHENLDKSEALLHKLRMFAFGSFLVLSLIISFIATWIVRKIASRYEKQMAEKNLALEDSNSHLVALNERIEGQKVIISNHAQNLESEVEKRTRELKDAHAKLGELEKAKSDFLSIISHELRTPLNGIIGFSHVLEEEVHNPEQIEFVQHIKTSGEKLLKFAETALLVTQLSEKKHMFELKKLEFKPLLDELLDDLGALPKQIQLKLESAHEGAFIKGEKKLVKQCVHNIIENAIRYSPVRGIISLSLAESDDGNYCELTIEDEGEGFSEEAYLRQFDLFGADKVMNHTEGYGLGLAAAHLIMRSHSGNISIGNAPEGGAVVKLGFPAA